MIESVHIKHYKAIQDSQILPLSPFAVFIGNNGSGKSSVFEALQLLRDAVVSDISTAFGRWGGMESVRNNRATHARPARKKGGQQKEFAPVVIGFTCQIDQQTYRYEAGFTTSRNSDLYLVEYESLHVDDVEVFDVRMQENAGYSVVTFKLDEEEAFRQGLLFGDSTPNKIRYLSTRLFLLSANISLPQEGRTLADYITKWQFLALNAQTMGYPVPQNRLTSVIRLQPDGSNLAEFIRSIARDPDRLDSLIEKMKFVLPYASDIQTQTSEDFDRKIQLRLYEEGQKVAVPGWLFSSGTLRILAILAVLESPNPPTTLFIDEVENGLDPRTIGLLINEFQQQYASRQTQIVVTTHSPYFLDLVPLESIIVSEKTNEGNFFHLPKDEKSLAVWRDKFSPGKLYTMGRLTK